MPENSDWISCSGCENSRSSGEKPNFDPKPQKTRNDSSYQSAAQNSFSPQVNKTFTTKRASQTSPRDVSPAATPERMAEPAKRKCSLPHALPADARQRFLFSPETIVLFIAAIAFLSRDSFSFETEQKDTPLLGVSFCLFCDTKISSQEVSFLTTAQLFATLVNFTDLC